MDTKVGAWFWAERRQVAQRRLSEVRSLFSAAEAELSRFQEQSSLSRLNRAAGCGPTVISPVLSEVLELALEHAERTFGIFDPTVLRALQRAGYTRGFSSIGVETSHGEPQGLNDVADWRAIKFDRFRREVTLPAGLQIDLGGIGKGWTVDRAAEMLGRWGPALVDAGGDIRATSSAADRSWPVAIANPYDDNRDLKLIQLADQGVATSSVLHRKWLRLSPGGKTYPMHHLIDPRTGAPSRGDWVSVTVVATTAVEAEIAAKVALILGAERGQQYLEASGLSALVMDCRRAVSLIGPSVFEFAG